jgi:methylthioxylose transferase
VTITAPVPASPNVPVAPARTRNDVGRTVIAVGAWVALIVIAAKWGDHVIAVGDRLRINAPPLAGDYRTRDGQILLVPIAVAALVVWNGPRLSRVLRWELLLGVAMASAIVWAIALGLNDGWRGLTDPLVRLQYIRTVPKVGNPFSFLSTFTDRLPGYNIHTQGHPPGMVLVLWTLDGVGLGGVGANLALVLAGGAASVAAVMVAVREVAGEAAARAAAPFLVLAPAAIWWSSGDAFFAGVSAWAITLVVLATGTEGRRSDRFALAGGLLFGAAAMLSYGLVLLAVLPVVIAIARRRFRPLVVAALGAGLIFLAFLAVGFSWLAGLAATRTQYWAGVASRRPYWYFIVGNLGAFALAVGPVAAVGLARLRDRRVWLLVGGVLLVIALADLSGMSKGEVERVWLPFVPWVLLATVAIVTTRKQTGWTRLWLGSQAAIAIAIQAAVRSPW